MSKSFIPEGYKPVLNLYDTQRAIGMIKRLFEDTLSRRSQHQPCLCAAVS